MKLFLPWIAWTALTSLAQGQAVLVPEWMKADAADLTEKHPSLKFDYYRNTAEALEKIAAAEGYIGSPDAELMAAGTKLRWVHIFSAGIEKHAALPGFADGRVAMTSLKIQQGPEIADHAFALLLGLTRNLPAYTAAQTEGRWARGGDGLPLVELRGLRMLVIGYGGIGTQVAERAAAFGMTVNAIDPKDIPLTRTLERTGKPDELSAFLPMADVVVSCAPLTPETAGMIGTAEFGMMKKGAYLINVSRGGIVDTAALVTALREGRLAGAGLDVVDPEPLPADHPLWKMANVILTPHVAGVSEGRVVRQNELLRDNLARFARGLPLKNLVDPAKGY